jgi:hypothetical protein
MSKRSLCLAAGLAVAFCVQGWFGHAHAQSVWIGGVGEPSVAGTRSITTTFGKADGVQTDIVDCNDSSPFRNMTEMLVSFKIAGSVPRAVIVLFEGEWFSFSGEGPTQARIRLSIDGIPQVEEVVLATRRDVPSEDGTHGYNFVTDALAPGLHVARIQWGVGFGGRSCIGDRSLIVLHK